VEHKIVKKEEFRVAAAVSQFLCIINCLNKSNMYMSTFIRKFKAY